MITSVKIERYQDYEELVRVLSRCEAAPATNRDLIRPLHYQMLIGTHIPDEYQAPLGALAVLLFRDQNVLDIEIWRINNGAWLADALIETARGQRNRRGEGKTPVEAALNLLVDIQRY
jgi:hypothetical protein